VRAGRWAGALALAGLAAVVVAVVPVPAAAAAPPPGTDVRVDPPPVAPGAVYPVEPIVFPTATADGAVVVEGGGSVRMSADVMFDVDRAALTPRAGEELARLVGELRAAGVRRVEVVGHTDDRGDEADGLRLSLARAEAVCDALAAALGPGVEFAADGRGGAEPVADNATDAGRALNRRVQVTHS
jgi:outer membrane protein OmpA-like peptidoglycan-associated protein